MLTLVATAAAAAGTGWFVREKSLRRTHPMRGGIHTDISLPHNAEFELWHNAFSLCSKKVRMCLAELGTDYLAHHVDLVETGGYETIGRRFLAINPAGLVPVLVHDGHPVYESHEIIRYAADHSAQGGALVPQSEEGRRTMDEWIRRASLFGDDPTEHIEESAGNCIPGLTVPLFAAMIPHIATWRILEGLLFHRLRRRPAFFLALKVAGLERIASLGPVAAVIRRSRDALDRHLDALERHLAGAASDEPAGASPWIAGAQLSLADVSWAVIFDRLREADWTALANAPTRPHVAAWSKRIGERPSFHRAMLGEMEHPLVRQGTAAIVALKYGSDRFRELYET